MSAKYYEEHDISFWKKVFDGSEYTIENPKFAWSDWGLIPTSRPYISTPKANYTLTQIPNSSTRLNITDFMPGGMTFESRTGEWQFAIDHTKELWKNWYDGYYKIEEYFHGSRMLVSLNDDAEKIYEGRITVSAYDPRDYYSTVTLQYDLDVMPIDEEQKRDMTFRIRTIGYDGYITKEQYQPYGTKIVDGGNYGRPYLLPSGAVFSKWNPPTPAIVNRNFDVRPVYYFKVKRDSSYSVPASNAIANNALSSHPIQYIIEEPEEKTEETYEVPDTVKFLFNNVKYSIDVMGAGGTTQKRLWYTPDNLGIETTE